MAASRRTIVAIGGSGLGPGPAGISFNSWLLSLTGKRRPRVCLVPTASGDSDAWTVTFYETYGQLPCETAHLNLYRRTETDLRGFLLAQDLIFVSGGNTANMIAIWKVHGVDRVLREAWESGTVLAGTSAGALCWFESGTTDSFGGGPAPLHGCLGFLPGSMCPHAGSEPLRLPAYAKLVESGELPAGYAASDFAALRFEGRRLAETVAIADSGQAWRYEWRAGKVRQTALEPRMLTEPPARRPAATKRLGGRPVGA